VLVVSDPSFPPCFVFYTHTYIHTYIHTYTHTFPSLGLFCFVLNFSHQQCVIFKCSVLSKGYISLKKKNGLDFRGHRKKNTLLRVRRNCYFWTQAQVTLLLLLLSLFCNTGVWTQGLTWAIPLVLQVWLFKGAGFKLLMEMLWWSIPHIYGWKNSWDKHSREIKSTKLNKSFKFLL
jgi:hypothetical protein